MKNVLVPIDFSDVTDRVIEAAVKVARPFRSKLWLLYCAEETPAEAANDSGNRSEPINHEAMERSLDEYRQLNAWALSLRNEGIEVQMLLVQGSAVDAILAAIEQHNIDLTIMGSQGHNAVWDNEVGIVTENVLNRSGRPVLVIPSCVRMHKSMPDTSDWYEPIPQQI